MKGYERPELSECLFTIIGTQLIQNVLHVSLDRMVGDEELLRDVTFSISVDQLTKNLDFAIGKPLVALMFRQLGSNGGRNLPLARMKLYNGALGFALLFGNA